MNHKHLSVVVVILAFSVGMIFAQSTGDFRSKQSGNWNTVGTWERFDGSSWVNAIASPTSTANQISVRNGHTVTISANVTIDQVVVESTGQLNVNNGITATIANGSGTDLTVNGIVNNAGTFTTTGTIVFANGSKYQHNWPAGTVGTIPTATWSDGSLCEIINMDGTGSVTKLQGTSQSFYDFYWNTPLQDQSVYIRGDSFRPVRHDFKIISTGSSNIEVSMVEVSPWRLDITNYIQESGTFTISRNATGAQSYTMNISGNFNMSGGTLTTGTFVGSAVVFNGTGTQTFSKTGGTLA